jgi:4-phospho-D-threonate 3-dehydrogenase / 4-phospho-D-erythronate 3-dehydrogenase
MPSRFIAQPFEFVSAPQPILAVTMGDPAGTGPELIVKALAEPELRGAARFLVIGDAAVLREAAGVVGAKVQIDAVQTAVEAGDDPERIAVVDLHNVSAGQLQRGTVSPLSGHAAYQYICRAVELTRRGETQAVVTSAINKASLHAAGHHYDGHTELLADLCGRPRVTMMLVAGKLRVCHVSTHVSLRAAIDRVRPERIVAVLRLAHAGIRELGIARPRLAVAGLNPHAGEGGLFGDEEQKYIVPAITLARGEGLDVSGPYAGDTVFFRTLQGEFDGAIAMYHDQGHVAAKMLGIWQGVNVTLGLPIIRTSVEHGTDFANAGTGRGDPRSLVQALKLAAQMAGNRLGDSRPV